MALQRSRHKKISMKDFYLLVAGTRTFEDYNFLKEKLDHLLINQKDQTIHIVSGGARGADALAEKYAKEKGYKLHIFPADWDRYGKYAGPKRNRQMHEFIAQYEHRGCVCFWDGKSKGTQYNFELSKEFQTPLRTIMV